MGLKPSQALLSSNSAFFLKNRADQRLRTGQNENGRSVKPIGGREGEFLHKYFRLFFVEQLNGDVHGPNALPKGKVMGRGRVLSDDLNFEGKKKAPFQYTKHMRLEEMRKQNVSAQGGTWQPQDVPG